MWRTTVLLAMGMILTTSPVFAQGLGESLDVDDFFTIFLQVLPNYEHGWWSMPAQFNTKGHQDMRYPILVLLTTLVVASLGATRVPKLSEQERAKVDRFFERGILTEGNWPRYYEALMMEMAHPYRIDRAMAYMGMSDLPSQCTVIVRRLHQSPRVSSLSALLY